MKKLLIDITPLRHSSVFRGLWLSSLLSSICSQIGVFAVTVQVFAITHDSLAVGAIGLFVAVPTIIFAFVGGNLADVIDRRKLMIFTSAAQLAIGAMLFAQALLGFDSVWAIYVLVALQSTLGAIGVPTRRAALRRILPARMMPAALALYLFSMHAGQILGPALSGTIAAAWGLQICFAMQAFGFLVSLTAASKLPPLPPEPGTNTKLGLSAVAESLRFIFRNPVLRGAFLADLSLTVLGLPIALLPALNAERFGGQPETLGVLSSSIAVGALLGTLFSGPLGAIKRKGLVLLVFIAVWGFVIGCFAFSYVLPVSLVLLAISGAADVLSLTLNQSIVQDVTPDHLRGRVSAAEHVVQMGGTQLGSFRGGLVGSLVNTTASVVGGAIATLAAVAALAFFTHGLRSYPSEGGGEAATVTN